MLKIGDFSHLAQVSIKMLRHYDDIGLLKPAHIDRFTGYRYYTLEQLPRLNRILALKDLGLSLEQIATLLADNITVDQIRAMLRLKHAELQQQMNDMQTRLERLEIRLQHIELENNMPNYEIIIKRIEPQRVLSVREIAPTVRDISRLFGEVNQVLHKYGIKAAAPWIAMYHHQGYREIDMDLEIAVPVEDSISSDLPLDQGRQMTIRTIPAIDMAVSALLQGNYNAIGDVYAALSRYIHSNGYDFVGPAREVYLRGPEQSANVDDYLTEIQEPVSKIVGQSGIEDDDLPDGWKDLRPIRAHYGRFTKRARQALRLAETTAAKLNQTDITPAHVLLGLLQEQDGMASAALRNLGITFEAAQELMPVGANAPSETKVSDAARQVITYAATEAQQLIHDYIGTEHLLLGLIKQGEASVMSIFAKNKVDSEQVRAEILG